MPESILQSNWYYGTDFDKKDEKVKAYVQLDEKGFDQIPTASNHSSSDNMAMTVQYAKKNIASPHLLGFMQTTWRPTLETFRRRHTEAIAQVGQAIKIFEREDL